MNNEWYTVKGITQFEDKDIHIISLELMVKAISIEEACKKALGYTATPSYKSIKNLLVTGVAKTPENNPETTHKAHGITRGADYYRR